MKIRTQHGSGMLYSSDFLQQLSNDLRALAIDLEKCGGKTSDAVKLCRASDVVRMIEMENEK